jgi:hypothetical protein
LYRNRLSQARRTFNLEPPLLDAAPVRLVRASFGRALAQLKAAASACFICFFGRLNSSSCANIEVELAEQISIRPSGVVTCAPYTLALLLAAKG